jgi:TolA-binding protein
VAKKCEAWIAEFPKDPMLGEVLSLLGDALAAQDKNAEAAYAYERSYKAATTDEVLVYSIFEASKQMQKAGQWEELAGMFEEFVKKNPEHQAAVAGMYWIGRAKSKMGKTEEAKAFLVEQLTKFLNEPKREAVESLLNQLANLPEASGCTAAATFSRQAGHGAVSLAAAPAAPASAAGAPAVPTVVPTPEPAPWDPFAEFERSLDLWKQVPTPLARRDSFSLAAIYSS